MRVAIWIIWHEIADNIYVQDHIYEKKTFYALFSFVTLHLQFVRAVNREREIG